MPRLLVIASAPAYMNPSPKNKEYVNALKKENLGIPADDIEAEADYMAAAKPFSRKAKDLFRGSFRDLIRTVQAARSTGIHTDLFIISPRYGLVSENDYLLPYTFSLARKSGTHIGKIAEKTKIREKLKTILSSGYDSCIIVANLSDMPLIHSPQHNFSLENFCRSLIIFSAPSASIYFSTKVKIVSSPSIRKRIANFSKYIEEMTTKPLIDFSTAD